MNNPSTPPNRFDYVKYDDVAQTAQDEFKAMYVALADKLDAMPRGRAVALATTKLEESYMWIGNMLRDDQIARNGSAPLRESRG